MEFIKTDEIEVKIIKIVNLGTVRLPKYSNNYYIHNLQLNCDTSMFKHVKLLLNKQCVNSVEHCYFDTLRTLYKTDNRCIPLPSMSGDNYLPTNYDVMLEFEFIKEANIDSFKIQYDVYKKDDVNISTLSSVYLDTNTVTVNNVDHVEYFYNYRCQHLLIKKRPEFDTIDLRVVKYHNEITNDTVKTVNMTDLSFDENYFILSYTFIKQLFPEFDYNLCRLTYRINFKERKPINQTDLTLIHINHQVVDFSSSNKSNLIRVKDVSTNSVSYYKTDKDFYSYILEQHPNLMFIKNKTNISKTNQLYAICIKNEQIFKISVYEKKTKINVNVGYIYNSTDQEDVINKIFSYELINIC